MNPLELRRERLERLKDEHRKYYVTDCLVYSVQQIGRNRVSWVRCVNSYIKEHVLNFVFLIDVAKHLDGETEQYVAIVTGGIGAHEDELTINLSRPQVGDASAQEAREWRQNDLVLVCVADLAEGQQIVSGLVSTIWLYRLDQFLGALGQVAEHLSAAFVEAVGKWVGFFLDRERRSAAWPRLFSERELPREVIQARAEIVRDIADYYTKSYRGWMVDFQAPDVLSLLRVYLSDETIGFEVKESVDVHAKRIQMLKCTPEFFSWPVKGVRHAASSSSMRHSSCDECFWLLHSILDELRLGPKAPSCDGSPPEISRAR
jgi:hypothetical protein